MNASLAVQIEDEPQVRAEATLASFPMCVEDLVLVEAVRAGDPNDAALLYDMLRPTIERALRRVVQGHSDFEDLVQSSFERVIRSITRGNFEGRSRLATWAYSVAEHVAMDWRRTRNAQQRLAEAIDSRVFPPEPYNALTQRQLEARSELMRVQRVLDGMKRLSALALILHDVHDLPVPEVARLLGLTTSAAESRVRRARRELVRRRTKAVSSPPASLGAGPKTSEAASSVR